MNSSADQKADLPLQPETWVDEHADVLFRYALLRVRRSEVAEDLVQETFLAALHGRETYSGKSSVRTWMIGILRHKILDYFRRTARERPADPDPLEEETHKEFFDSAGHWKHPPAQWKSNPELLSENLEFWAVFQRCLEELPETVAKAFALRELEQSNSEEICKVLEISSTNLWVRLHRARLQLRRCLELNWFVVGE